MKHHTFEPKGLKYRSQSMPSINPIILPQPIHHIKKNRKKSFISSEQHQPLPIISLMNIHNREEEELNSKIKVIAERSLKKLQEKYDTIDRWKQKYVPQSSLNSQRHKFNFNQVFPPIQQKKKIQEPQTPTTPIAATTPENASKLLPIISKPPINQQIPDYRDKSKKLQAELLARLQRNKKYYQIKNNQQFKQINYFNSLNDMPLQKRRQNDMKNIIGNKKNKLLNILHKKMSNPQNHHLQKQGPIFNLFQEPSNNKKLKLKKSQSIHEFKEQLLQQAVQQVPEGWNIANQPNSPEQQEPEEI